MAACLYYLGATAIAPGRAFRKLEHEPKKLSKGFRVMILIGLLYTISAGGLAAAGALLPAPIFVPLPSQNYYFYEMFFALPVFILAWLVGAGGGTIASIAAGGRGSFKTAASAWAFAFAVPSFLMWLPHAVFSGFLILGMSQQEFMSYTASPGPWRTAFWTYQGLAGLVLIVGSVKAAAFGRSLKAAPALLTGLLASGLFAGVVGVLIR